MAATKQPPRIIVEPGARSYRLTFIRMAEHRRGERMCLVRCDCGAEKVMQIAPFARGRIKSCGCLAMESSRQTHRRHGMAADLTPTYISWTAMRERCNNPSASNYRRYGGRGVKVCERWDSFESFLADMGERPDGTTLDRFPQCDGNYEPGNCRWATSQEQSENKSTNRYIEFRGERLTLSQWAARVGISGPGLAARIRVGWSIEDALTRSRRKQRY